MANANIITLSNSNFDQEVTKAQTPVLVDFWAEWCGPCKMIAPLIDEVAEEKAGKLKVGKINVDENQELATKFGIHAIPTLLIFKGGQVKETIVGAPGKKDLEKKLAPHLG
ncbi:MAG TPA: thioredoxin [Verrucomicrobiae bacterium]|nr:thioredoxin [Verrucomicrobiae bacterium]